MRFVARDSRTLRAVCKISPWSVKLIVDIMLIDFFYHAE